MSLHLSTNDTLSVEDSQSAWDIHQAAAVEALMGAYRAGADMGEFICHVVTATAANAGGAEGLLSARTGSPEADDVRRIVRNMAGDALDHLAAFRTEPVRIYLDSDAIFDELGLVDVLEEERDALDEPVKAADAALPESLWEYLPGPVLAWEDPMVRPTRLREDLSDDTLAQIAAVDQLEKEADRRYQRMMALHAADGVAYRANLREAMVEQLAAHGLQDREFVILEEAREYVEPHSELGALLGELEQAAIRHAIVPPLGRPRADIEGPVVDAVRAARLTYTERDAAGERAPRAPQGEQPPAGGAGLASDEETTR